MTDDLTALRERQRQRDIGWNAALTVVSRFGSMLTDRQLMPMQELREYIEGLKK